MAFTLKDRVSETTVTTGTGTVTLLGAVRGYQAFSAIGDGNPTCYLILSGDGVNWEVGIGTYTLAGTTLSRTTVLGSSNSGSAITLVGTSLVCCTNPANQIGANGLYNQLFGSPADGNYSLNVASGVWSVTAAAAAAGRALYSGSMGSSQPTIAGTGLANWVNQQSSTFVDSAVGPYLQVPGAATGLVGRKTNAGGTLTTTALLGGTSVTNGVRALGWTDGTKFHIISSYGASALLRVDRWSNTTTFLSADYTMGIQQHTYIWLQVQDDGTNVKFRYSFDGTNFVEVFTVAKASGYLGATGYSAICILTTGSGASTIQDMTLFNWASA